MSVTVARKRDLVTFHCAGKPYSLKFNHLNLRNVALRTGKEPGELIGTPFSGWPELLAEGLRHKHQHITPEDACKLIQEWMDEGREFADIGKLLVDALTETGYLKKTVDEGEDDTVDPRQAPTPIA